MTAFNFRIFGRRTKDGDADSYDEEQIATPEAEETDSRENDLTEYDGRFGDRPSSLFSAEPTEREDDYAESRPSYDDDGYDGEDDPDDGYDDEEASDADYIDDEYYDTYPDGEASDSDYVEDDYDDGYEDDDYDDTYDSEDDYASYDEDGGQGQEHDAEAHYDDGYDEYEDKEQGDRSSGFQDFIERNDWLTYGLLFLFPPLGIYLLIRRKRFSSSFRYAIAAASAIWCVLLIALLVRGLKNTGDESDPFVKVDPLPTSNVVQQVTISPDANKGDEEGGGGTVSPTAGTPTAAPTATPNVSSTVNAEGSASLVWTSAASSFYHNKENCAAVAATEVLTRVTIDNARTRGKFACPICYGGTIYYGTPSGDYYHSDRTCSGMKNAQLYSIERAKAENKAACPVCITKTAKDLPSSKGGAGVVFLTQSTADKSGVKVWFTSKGSNYHVSSTCGKMTGARQGTLKEALLAGKTACKTCCSAAGTLVFCTSGGRYYHSKTNCSGMKDSSAVTLSEALVLGKEACPTCRPLSIGNKNSSSSSSAAAQSEYYVYATVNGKYYHIKSNCSGMSGAQRITLKQAITLGKRSCPTCCGGADTMVYAASGNQYYHSYATCSGIRNARSGPLAYALALGLKRCPVCWQSSSSSKSSASSGGSSSSGKTAKVTAANANVDNVYVYATRSSSYYHTNSKCSGMKGATRLTLRQAITAGKRACPTCAARAYVGVYSTNGGKYYHINSTCSGMSGAKKRTLQQAMQLGQTACPVCIGSGAGASKPASPDASSNGKSSSGSTNGIKKVANFKTGTSGISVYVSASNKYYHTKRSCVSGLRSVPLETALNYGRAACPKCASSSAIRIYATKNGKYYHLSRSCAGSGAVSNTLAVALAAGFKPCPYCVTGKTSSAAIAVKTGTYKTGTSGIKVYATASGPYYHANKTHAGSGALSVPLETAMNYGKKACPTCCRVASATVYSSSGDKYFHIYKAHAGSNAVSGSLAKALALGLTACPTCSSVYKGGGNQTVPQRSAPAASIVYVDLYASTHYYHSAAKCQAAGVTGGQGVTLEYAKDFGYAACPYCHPPTSIQ